MQVELLYFLPSKKCSPTQATPLGRAILLPLISVYLVRIDCIPGAVQFVMSPDTPLHAMMRFPLSRFPLVERKRLCETSSKARSAQLCRQLQAISVPDDPGYLHAEPLTSTCNSQRTEPRQCNNKLQRPF
jgi:hypothetical protein